MTTTVAVGPEDGLVGESELLASVGSVEAAAESVDVEDDETTEVVVDIVGVYGATVSCADRDAVEVDNG